MFSDLNVQQLGYLGQALCLDCLVLEQTSVIVFFVAEQDFSEVFDIIWDEKSSDNDCKQMVVDGKLILSAKFALL